jgi:hypothetical protein
MRLRNANHHCRAVFLVLSLALLLATAQAAEPAVLLGTIPLGVDFPCGSSQRHE